MAARVATVTDIKAAPKKKKKKMTDSQVLAFIGRKVSSAMNEDGNDLSATRTENFNYYIGAPYGDEREGYSKYVTRETLETVEWVLPSVLRVFTSGDRVVSFDPEGPDDEAAAEQETDITNYSILKANKGKGFLALYNVFKDALMFPNAYIKAYIEECTTVDEGMVTGLTADAVKKLDDDPDVEILEQDSKMVALQLPSMPGMNGPPPTIQVELFDLKIRTTKQKKELCLAAVPGEQALIDAQCMSLDIDEANFSCHRQQRPFTELVNEGYDADDLEMAGGDKDGFQWGTEEVNRLFYSDENPQNTDDTQDPSMRMYWVHECHVWMDYDNDGIAEFRRVVTIGGKVFENEETNYQPLVAFSAIPMPHKHNGMSYIDIVKDLQLLKSVLTRQLLDNVYKLNIRRKAFSEDSLTEDGSTMAAMLNTQAEFIPVKGRADLAFFPEVSPSIVADLLPVMQYVDEGKNMRSGVSPNLALDPEVIQEATVGNFTSAMDQASQRVEMLVRILAETGMKTLLLKVHQLLRQHQDVARMIKLRGKWIPVDPQGWRDRTDMTANVGLGYNNKQQMASLLVQLIAMQKEALAGNLTDEKKIFHAFNKLTQATGLGDGEDYFTNPATPGWQKPQPPPDPNMVLAQAQAARLQAQTQLDTKKQQYDWQMDQQKHQAEFGLKAGDQQLSKADRVLEFQKMQQTAQEYAAKYGLELNELQATIRNKDADTRLKDAQALLAKAEAGHTAVQASDAFTKAKDIVAKQGSEDGTNPDEPPTTH